MTGWEESAKKQERRETKNIMTALFPLFLSIFLDIGGKKMIKCFFSCFFFFLLLGCTAEDKNVLLDRADKAFLDNQFTSAGVLYEEYLQEYPMGKERFHVWTRLSHIAQNVYGNHARALVLMEACLLEFGEDEQKAKDILWNLSELSLRLHSWAKAGQYLKQYSGLKSLTEQEKWQAEQKFAKVLQLQGQYVKARDIFLNCLENTADEKNKNSCLFSLAQIYFMQGETDLAQEKFQEFLQAEGIGEENKVLATFYLADILETKGSKERALELFLSLEGFYPNQEVLKFRIDALR